MEQSQIFQNLGGEIVRKKQASTLQNTNKNDQGLQTKGNEVGKKTFQTEGLRTDLVYFHYCVTLIKLQMLRWATGERVGWDQVWFSHNVGASILSPCNKLFI